MTTAEQTPQRPRDVVERRLRLAPTGDREAEIELFAQDAVVEFPFAPPEVPNRFEGRDAILRMHHALDQGRGADLDPIPEKSSYTVHETTDPETVIVELDARIRIPATNDEVPLRQIHVYRVRNGQIASVRDYFAADTAGFVRQALVSA